MLNPLDSQYLINYAVNNLWANTRLENNYIYKPKKITTDLPRIKYWQMQGVSLSLPDATSRWHLYLLGALSDKHLGITSGSFVGWVSLDTLMTGDNYIANVYQEDGLLYPASLLYLCRRPDGMIILAVKADNYPELLLGEQDIYFQIYRNRNSSIEVNGLYLTNESERVTWLNQLRTAQGKTGFTLINKNGYLALDVNASSVSIGDYVEYIYDSSILYVNEFTLLDLDSFESTENKARYYLVMNWDEIGGNDDFLLRYRNDTQFFIGDRNSQNGRFFHRNNISSLYQLTHQDLALKVSDVDYYLNQLSGENNATAKLISVVRDDGQSQVIEGDANRIYELYEMDKATIASNLLGVVASVTEWSANSFINCDYNEMLKTDYSFLTGELIYSSMGYFAADNILNKTPIKFDQLESGMLPLTPTQQKSVTCIEYKAGLLNNIQELENQVRAVPLIDSDFFDLRSGVPHTNLPDEFEYSDINTLLLNSNRWYRFYKGLIDVATGEVLEWVDVTTSGLDVDYEIVNNQFTWLVDRSKYHTKIKDSYHTSHVVNTLTEDSNTWIELPYTLGFAEVVTILNNRSLVEGIDYLIEWPYIAMVGKDKYTAVEPKEVHCFLKGFPKNPNNLDFNKEVGFVKYGSISFDSRYALKDWRNYRISVNGLVYALDELEFGEDLTVTSTSFINGTPYEWLTPATSLASLSDLTYVTGEKEKDTDLDLRVSQYLTENKPQVEFDTPSTYPSHYILFSTFMNEIIKSFERGDLSFTFEDINRVTLDVLLKDYLFLLNVDPCVSDTHLDWENVIVEPHQYTTPKVVSPDLYQILNAINQFYLNNRVSLIRLLQVS